MPPRRLISEAGRTLGIAAGAVLAALWSYIMWVPAAGLDVSGVSFAVAFLMCFCGIVAVLAAHRRHSAVLMIAFLASFLPVGALMLQVDLWLRWLGILDLFLLCAAALIWWGRPRAGALADGDTNDDERTR